MNILFRTSPEALAVLSAEESESLVMGLISAEAGSARVRLDQIYDGGRAGSVDGGVDFEVRNAPQDSAGGFIKRGHTLYRVKSGRFSPARDVRRMLLDGGGRLRDPIRSCLEVGGTLAVVDTRWAGSDTSASGLEGRFAEVLRGARAAPGGSVEVWTPARILGLLDRYPHLALSISPVPTDGLRTCDEWSRLHDMSHAFKPGAGEGDFVRRLRECLLGGNSPHIRVTGAPGAGKTRLVLEAVRDDRLRDRVIYAGGPGPLRQLLGRIGRGGADGRADSIVVVDDCRRPEQAAIWNEMKGLGGMRLVTIHSEEDKSGHDTVHMPVPPLGDTQLREIISTYVGAGSDLAAWAEYCKASPRAAHIVGENLRNNPDDMLRSPSTVAVWDRYIAGQNDLRGSEFEARKAVLEWLSLFKTFGYGCNYGRDLGRIAELVEKNTGISGGRFLGTIRTLRRMNVLQGTSMLCIAPKILHIYMWVEWWRNHTPSMAPTAGDLAGPCEGARGPQHLLQWYLDMFRYARHSPEASKVVKNLLRPGGFLDSDRTLKIGMGADAPGRP